MLKNKYETIIVGGGFGGLNAAIQLGKLKKEVLVIDRSNHHLFQPLLYQVATAGLSPADIASPIREILKKYPSITVIMEKVVSINTQDQLIQVESKKTLAFENLILAIGARHSYFGNEHWEKFAPGLKSLEDAIKIRENILRSFELSELETDNEKIKALITFIVIGGGPTGVEMAGAIAEIATKTLVKNYSQFDSRKSNIYLIEGTDRVLNAFHPSLSKRAKKDLEKLGVIVKLNSMVKNIDENGVTIGDDLILAKNIVWAAGNKANPLLKTLDISLDKMGRVLVESDCSIKSNSNIFVIGDAACFKTSSGYLPSLAPIAAQQGKYVARLIAKKLTKEYRKPFFYINKGTMATIGTSKAVLELGNFHLSGFFAWLTWSLVHLLFLVQFRNKISILFNWIYHYFTEQRGVRLIK
jgi:NADH dehydrogenase